jgi:hypothetical protein
VTTEGAAQVITGTASDGSGNKATTAVVLKVEKTPPRIVAVASPPPNAANWNKSDVTVSFQCINSVSGGIQCPAPTAITSEGANQLVSGTITDVAGISSSAAITINLDKTPPALNVVSPASGSNFNSGKISVQGLISDALSGFGSLSCNGTAAVITGTAFTCDLTLAKGSNAISVVATDVAGNTSSFPLAFGFVIPIKLQINSPAPLQLFSSNPVTVTGTVDNANAAVIVNGVAATVSGGFFTATGVTLREGRTLLTASATSADGGVGSDTVPVFLDTTPPVVHIDNPGSGAIVTSPQIDVTGNVNDLVTGTVNGAQVSVSVNGVAADVANRSFAAHNVLLVPGANTITAVATDHAGNTSRHLVQITLRQGDGQQTLSTVSGNNQSGAIGAVLAQSLVVQATDGLGRPLANVPLSFAVVKSDGVIISGQQRGRTLTVQTDSNGNASVQFQIGSRNGVGVNQVAVTAPGFVGSALFSADSVVGAPTQIHTVSGEIQTGAVGVALPEPLMAIVMDGGGNPVPNVAVIFTVKSGGGTINGQTSFTQNTDADGKAFAVLVLGQQEGVGNNVVSATFNGATGQAAAFRSSGVVPGPVENTVITGIVLDDANQPIPNATASVKGTNLSALTNASGRFTIVNAPVGDIVLFIDGSTSTESETYPTLSFQMATIPGIDNTLPGPIFLPAIDTDNSQVAGGDQDVILTMKNVPGVAYKIFAHSVTFPDGTHVGRLTLSQVHADKVPMTPPNGSAARLVGTLQPSGVKFDPPVQMVLPNTDALAPGQILEIFSFHHDVEQFVTEGTAHVTEDASAIISDPGFGLTVSGWHGGNGPPPPPTCADGCASGNDPCNTSTCDNGACVTQPANEGGACGDGTSSEQCGKKGKCTNGACVFDSTATDGQDCKPDDKCVQNPKCKSGVCKGEEFKPDEHDVSGGLQVKLPDEMVKQIAQTLSSIGIGTFQFDEATFSVKGKASTCCNPDTGDVVKDGQLENSAGLKLTLHLKNIPILGCCHEDFFVSAGRLGSLLLTATVGPVLKVDSELSGEAGSRSSQCDSKENCVFGQLSAANVLALEGEISISGCLQIFNKKAKCGEITPAQISISVSLEAGFALNKEKCSDGLQGFISAGNLTIGGKLHFGSIVDASFEWKPKAIPTVVCVFPGGCSLK